ncbi:MAG: AP2 domain-containing protein [Planctomycetota bacterium]
MQAVEFKIRIYLPGFLFRLRVWIVLRYRKMRYGYAFRKIPLTQGKYAIVDPEDYKELAKYKWFAARKDRRFYAVRWVKGKNVKMHHVIMGTEEGKVIDHINGNGLDNRNANVRFATVQQNGWNKRKQWGDYSSKYKGVSWEKKRKEWRARITLKGRLIHLGRFETEEEAARTYDAKARELFGEFAWLNFPSGPAVGGREKRRNWMKKRRINWLRFARRIQLLAKMLPGVYNKCRIKVSLFLLGLFHSGPEKRSNRDGIF